MERPRITWADYIRDYQKEKTTTLSVKLNNEADADIIEHLGKSSNKSGLVKMLLREYFKKEK